MVNWKDLKVGDKVRCIADEDDFILGRCAGKVFTVNKITDIGARAFPDNGELMAVNIHDGCAAQYEMVE